MPPIGSLNSLPWVRITLKFDWLPVCYQTMAKPQRDFGFFECNYHDYFNITLGLNYAHVSHVIFFSSKTSCLKPKSLSVENVDFWKGSVSMAETSHMLLHGTGSWWVGIIVRLSESLCFSAVSSNRLSSVPVIAHIPPDCLETRHGDDSADGALLYCANSCLAVWYTHIPLMIK